MTKIEQLKALTEEDLTQAITEYTSTKAFMRGNNFPVSHKRYSDIVNNKLSEFGLSWNTKSKYKEVICPVCNTKFSTKNIANQKKTCSDKCAKELTARSTRVIPRDEDGFTNHCYFCGVGINSNKFCSTECRKLFNREQYINKWKSGEESGNYNSKTLGLSKHVRRYLLEKYNYACVKCGWNNRHPVDGLPLVEINHIDGNAANSIESNLEVLCPNCHSMTHNFRARNKQSARDRT